MTILPASPSPSLFQVLSSNRCLGCFSCFYRCFFVLSSVLPTFSVSPLPPPPPYINYHSVAAIHDLHICQLLDDISTISQQRQII
jgi:hypothetical protein